ncbi:hypothetical protein [Emticicia agri]|uniref:Uncharacterized protein n=1 Tax=Emticicia agri TaxID=2492393 RepID=A0A4Q5LWT3_9BACT|nr:hypothetical protein [Emticicia agri]RYU94172.1 hypothetical protein EWM59_18535 [Emticicia agri]
MKKLLILLIATLLSGNVFAQSGTMLPDGFIVPNLAEPPACMVEDKGKMYYNTVTSTLMVCNGTQWLITSSIWDPGAVANSINYGAGNVGIGTSTPQYKLDVNGTARVSNSFFANLGISIGTTSASSGLNIGDGAIAITSTADAKTWKFDYNDDENILSLKEDGVARMIFANGGNIGVGSAIPTATLSVDGTGSFSGNLTVNGGKGIVRTTSATSLKTHIVQVSLGTTFTVLANGCATSSPQNITSAGFTAAPTIQVGNLVLGTGDFGKLVANVQSVSTTSFMVRFCNNTASNVTLSNSVFNIMCVGQ